MSALPSAAVEVGAVLCRLCASATSFVASSTITATSALSDILKACIQAAVSAVKREHMANCNSRVPRHQPDLRSY